MHIVYTCRACLQESELQGEQTELHVIVVVFFVVQQYKQCIFGRETTSSSATPDCVQVAYDSDGKPSKALLGFCKKNGIEESAVTQQADKKGVEYVWAEKEIQGQPAAKVQLEASSCHLFQHICNTQ